MTLAPPTRLGAPTLGALVLAAAERHAGACALRTPDAAGGWRDVTYAELGVAAREIAGGLIALGVSPGDRVAVLAATCAQWTVVDCGALCAGAIVVPIYHTNSPAECAYVLEHSGAKVVLCEDAAQHAKVEAVREGLPALEHVVTFDGSSGLGLGGLRALAADVAADAVDRAVAAVASDDVATIIYTSGTTGPPKGCNTTHANLLAAMGMYEQRLQLGDQPGSAFVVYLFLPLAHTLTRTTELCVLDCGGTLAFWRGDMTRVAEDLAALRPTHVPVVPRVLEKIHKRVQATAQDGGAARTAALRVSLSLGRRMRAAQRRGVPGPPALRVTHRLADRAVLARVRALFGDRLELVLTGAAPVATDVLRFFDACGVPVLEGYGLTETTAAATLNTREALRIGSVGRPLPGAEVAIADDGEILLRGPQVFPGYHRDEDATRAALSDEGWLRTGDLGSIDADGFVHVTGRKKDLIVTSSGKNVAPAVLEAALADRPWISQAVAYGDRHPYVVALLTLDPSQAPELARRCGVVPQVATMAAEPAVHAVLQGEVDAVNANLARVEQVKRFAILPRELSQAEGELTPTAKVRRTPVYQRHRERFEALYEEGS